MNVGLIIGKKNSSGVPGKNIRIIMGRPAAEYAFIAATSSLIDKLYVSSDSEEILGIGEKYGANLINRPAELATKDALTEDALLHAWDIIKKDNPGKNIDTISLLFCNNPAIDVEKLNEAITFLKSNNEFDSAFSVVKYDMFSPTRARKLGADGQIEPFVSLDVFESVSSIRDSQGSVYFCDLSIQCMKPVCFEEMDNGQLPFKWQGKSSKAIPVDFGFDIDADWQVPVIEYWLKKRAFTETSIPWKK